jgi:geranylgeranyl diphosphate synthase type II
MFTASQLLDKINFRLENLDYFRYPEGLYAPVQYVLSQGGKRIRPILMMMAYELYQKDVDKILNQAAAIEIYHNFTLLHDDLMDCADKRRGNPTVHVKWNNNTAVLSGDAMTVLAYRYMSTCNRRYLQEIIEHFSATALEICEGQQLDMEFESRNDVSEAEYIEMIRLKTAVLLACSLKIGAILGGAIPEDATKLYNFGIQIGLAFQLQDDYLDVYGNSRSFGKNIGGDILCNKKTFLLIKAFEQADEAQTAQLCKWLTTTEFDPKEKITAVTNIYNELGISIVCGSIVRNYYAEGIKYLETVSVTEDRKRELKDFVQKLMFRVM